MAMFKPGAWGFVIGSLQAGWATIGEGEANGVVAEACASQLLKVVAK